MNNDYFNPMRFWLVLKHDEFLRWRSLIISALTIAGVTILLTLLLGFDNSSHNLHVGLYPLMLFFGGFLAASSAFGTMHSRESVHDWIMLPASAEEKFLSRLAANTVGFWLFITLIYSAASLLGEGLSLVLDGNGAGGIFNPFDPSVLKLLPHFIILQSIFIAGGAFFRKHQFLKTSLMLALLGIAFGVFTALAARLVFGDYAHRIYNFNFPHDFDAPMFISTRRAGTVLFSAAKIVYFVLLTPFCWLTAYLRVREAEVRHAL